MTSPSCSTPPAPPGAARGCRAATGRSRPPHSPISRTTSTRSASPPSGSCRYTTTMGVRSLLSSAFLGGCFVCQPRFDAAQALDLIEAEGITSLYLVPTLYHDLLGHPAFSPERGGERAAGRVCGHADDGCARAAGGGGVPAPALRQPLWLLRGLHLHHRPAGPRQARVGRTGRAQPGGTGGAPRLDRPRGGGGAVRGGRGRSRSASTTTKRSTATGAAPTRTPRLSATGGTSLATPASRTTRATSSSPAGSTT